MPTGKTAAEIKRGLLPYYADISPFLLPHLLNRAMVMKRYRSKTCCYKRIA